MKKIIKIVLKWIIYAAVFPHSFVKGFMYGWDLKNIKLIYYGKKECNNAI
jgi:hypothetical protein